ncbi:MAG: transpeptidase family protein, partial [Deltaproteobacteria bacterium]|nr:transpeptidase family protein [Deltaproteobacteria bacterium]
QYVAEKELSSAVIKRKAKSGSVVVMKPDTGEILALACFPAFNPNIYTQYSSKNYTNTALTFCYEPGSTMKAFLAAAAIESGRVQPTTQFFCENGAYQVANRVVHDTHEYGTLSLAQIVKVSSNIGAVKIGYQLGFKNYHEFLTKFGFGQKTGIDLPGESGGILRNYAAWRPIDGANACFDQGVSVSVIQMATAFSAIANGGNLMKPYLVKMIADPQGRVAKRFGPQVVRRVISPANSAKMIKILSEVTEEGGTATAAAIEGYQVAGKTGTSQKLDPETKQYSKRKYISSFIGFFPAEKPKLLVFVMIDEPLGQIYGGLVAGPVFRDIGRQVARYLNIMPTGIQVAQGMGTGKDAGDWSPGVRIRVKELSESLASELATDEGITTMPDLRGLSVRQVIRRLQGHDIKLSVDGSGWVVKQDPSPGVPLDKVKVCSVKLSDDPDGSDVSHHQ